MDFPEFIRQGGHGAVARAVRKSGLSRNTVERAAKGLAIGAPQAKALSAATGEPPMVSAIALAGLA